MLKSDKQVKGIPVPLVQKTKKRTIFTDELFLSTKAQKMNLKLLQSISSK